MATPSTGSISMAQIAAEFGGTAPHSLDEYYGVASGVPSSGTIDFNSLRGKSSIVPAPAPVITAIGSYANNLLRVDYNNLQNTAFDLNVQVHCAALNVTKTYTSSYSANTNTSRNWTMDIWNEFGGLNIQVRARFLNMTTYLDSSWSSYSYGKYPILHERLTVSATAGDNLIRVNHPAVPSHGRTWLFVRFGRSTSVDAWEDEDNYVKYQPINGTTNTTQGGIGTGEFSVTSSYLELRNRYHSQNPWYISQRYETSTGELPSWNYWPMSDTLRVDTINIPQSITIYKFVRDDGDDMASMYYNATKTETVKVESGYNTSSDTPWTNRGTIELRAGTWVVGFRTSSNIYTNFSNHLDEYNLPSGFQTYVADGSSVEYPSTSLRLTGLTSGVVAYSNRTNSIRVQDDD